MLIKTWMTVLLALALGTAWGEEKVRLIAHRGGSLEADENTLAAFTDAYAKGLRAFETDVRITKDDQLVLMHDDTVDRTTGGHGAIETMTADEVKALRTKKSGSAVPFLAELLAAFKDKPGVFLQLEIKPGKAPVSDDRLTQFCRLLTEQVAKAMPPEAYCYSSFDKRSLAAVKLVKPEVSTTLLCSAAPDVKLLSELKKLGCDRVSTIPSKTSREFVQAAKQAGFRVAGWSVRTDEALALAQALGFEGVTTDCPRRMLAAGLGRP